MTLVYLPPPLRCETSKCIRAHSMAQQSFIYNVVYHVKPASLVNQTMSTSMSCTRSRIQPLTYPHPLPRSGLATCSLSLLTASDSVVGLLLPAPPADLDGGGVATLVVVGLMGEDGVEYCEAGEKIELGLAPALPLPLALALAVVKLALARLLIDWTISLTGLRCDRSGWGIGDPEGARDAGVSLVGVEKGLGADAAVVRDEVVGGMAGWALRLGRGGVIG